MASGMRWGTGGFSFQRTALSFQLSAVSFQDHSILSKLALGVQSISWNALASGLNLRCWDIRLTNQKRERR